MYVDLIDKILSSYEYVWMFEKKILIFKTIKFKPELCYVSEV